MNTFFCKFIPHALAHPDYCVFCGAIKSLEWERHQSGNGRRINYVPSALKAHDWQSSINAVYDAPEIDINPSAMLFYSGSQIFCIPQTRLQGI